MDEFDEERFASGGEALAAAGSRPRRRQGHAAAASTASGSSGRVIRRDEDREELLCARAGRAAVIRVAARSETGRVQLDREVQLLAALEVGGIGAAPSVLEIEDEGYVREDAAPLHARRGRRCAEEATPATGERQAQARARDSLDLLIDALHSHGWVLGAPAGEGLGLRADGSVTVLDLSGLRPEEGTGPRLDDRLWVDSVLRDEGRTLRRRIDRHPSSVALPSPAPPSTPGAGPRSRRAPRAADHVEGESADEAPDDEEVASLRPLPAPRVLSHPAGPLPVGADGAPVRRHTAGLLRRLGEELRAPGLRRIAVLSAVTVLITGGVLGSGVWWLAPQAPPPTQTTPTDEAALPSSEEPEVPRIPDPLSLATELTLARHDYLIGTSTDPVAAPGSPAEGTDEQVRRAYENATVEGPAPRVLSARVLDGPTQEGTARLKVETSTPAHTVIEADGTTTSAPATGTITIDLELRWSAGRWRVAEVLQSG